MLARRDTSRDGELDNAFTALFGAPCHERKLRPLEVGKVNVWRNSPPNNEVFRVAVNHMEVAVSPFDFDRLSNQYLCAKHTPHCPPLPLNLVPEQDEIGTNPENKRNPIISVKRLFLQAVCFSRPTAEPFLVVNPVTSSIGSVTVMLPTHGALANIAPRAGVRLLAPAQPIPFDNDNEPWREAA